jgi:hypothetical protein
MKTPEQEQSARLAKYDPKKFEEYMEANGHENANDKAEALLELRDCMITLEKSIERSGDAFQTTEKPQP